MGAPAEGHVGGPGALQVQFVGAVEGVRVAVGGEVGDVDGVARADGHPAEFDVLGGDAGDADALAERDQPQEFVDGRCQQVGAGAQQGQLGGAGQQGVGEVRDLVRGGVLAGDQQHHGHDGELLRVQHLVAVAGGGQGADEVGPRVAPTLRGQGGEVGPQVGLGPDGGGPALGGGVHHGAGVRAQGGAVALGDVQDVADHGERQRSGEVLHQVRAGAAGGHGVQQRVGGQSGAGTGVLQQVAGEGLRHQGAQPVARGRVHQVDGLVLDDRLGRHPGEVAPDDRVAAEPPVAGDGAHVVVAGDQPGVVLSVRQPDPGHRPFGHQLP